MSDMKINEAMLMKWGYKLKKDGRDEESESVCPNGDDNPGICD